MMLHLLMLILCYCTAALLCCSAALLLCCSCWSLCRLRVALSAAHSDDDIARLARALGPLLPRTGTP